jgi:NitT/TauT family transport system permease protein
VPDGYGQRHDFSNARIASTMLGFRLIRRVGFRSVLDPLLALVLGGLVWQYGVDFFQIKRYLLPPIGQILVTLWASREAIGTEALVTTEEVLLGYLLAVIVGVALALVIYVSPIFKRIAYPAIVMFQGLPKIALAPLMVVWFGFGLSSKVLMAFLFAFFPLVIATLGGLASTPAPLVEHFQALGASPWVSFRRLRIPSALPSIMDGCKTAMPLALIGAVAGEFVGSEKGLGNLILLANANARTDLLFAALIAISIIAGLLYLVVAALAARVWWRGL